MWVIRGGKEDRLVEWFVAQGLVGVEFSEVPDAEILTRSEIRRFLADGQTTAALNAQEDVLSAFVREVRVGDSMLLLDESRGEVVVGTVTSGYEFDGDVPDDGVRHQRAVEWLARHLVTELPSAVRTVTTQKLVLEQHRDAEWSGYLAQVRDGEIGRDPTDRPGRRGRPAPKPRRAAATVPRVVKPVLVMSTCSSCFLQTHPDRMRGAICVDCAE